MRKCESCGKMFNDSKDIMCPHCGAISSRKCTHDSIFDTKRYDRGEDYKGPMNTTYEKGVDPHAQRTSPVKNEVPQEGKTPKVQMQKNKSKLGIVIFVIILLVNTISALVSNIEDEYNWGESVVYEETDCFLDVGKSNITFEQKGDEGYLTIEFDDLYFLDSYADGREQEIANEIFEGAYIANIDVSYYEDDMFEESNTLSSIDESDKADTLRFRLDIPKEKMIFIDNLYMQLDIGDTVYLSFPYYAIEIKDDGSIVYLNDTSEESDLDISIEEVSPTQEYEEYIYKFSFEDYTGFEDYTETVSVPESIESGFESVSEYESVTVDESVSAEESPADIVTVSVSEV